ncbi:hypothetical protein FB45DRAFT_904170 [Roridomyces roridus]|uniref:Glutamine synthetase n=1 Tax=Roridomyces roridus TaxID=1738132 RepID=A0AAD7C4H8_9AGAR|nr:hypothetical protein FB45DRAFT_904170 [Roridomyces roridus]
MSQQYRNDLLAPYLALDQGEKVQAEYVWIDGDGGLRCKTTTVSKKVTDIGQLRTWDFDGSSTNQAPGHDSDVLLRPVAIFRDPFRGGDNILKVMEQAKDSEPWFGLEQEYTLFDVDGKPYAWPKGGFPGPQGPYYCGAAVSTPEVMPSQWEFQIGPCEGISMGDHLWMARYLLIRIAEQWGIVVSFHPKPLAGDWNGAGCHSNYSTKAMRQPGGMQAIEAAIEKMSKKHNQHIATGHITDFSSGVANRGASIRIPRHVAAQGYGYLEDRRPASNVDPYRVTAIIVETTILDQ